MRRPEVAILKTDGINCDAETLSAFNLAGGESSIVHVNELRLQEKDLGNFQILAIPGGFSYGDDVVSGKILAIELQSYLADQIDNFVNTKKGLVLGICNGFQVLVRTGLLPFGELGKMSATLTNNDSGNFECRWINLAPEEKNNSVFLKDLKGTRSFQVAHGEGKFFAPPEIIERVENESLVVFRYSTSTGAPTNEHPQNPNGSLNAIAGITDTSGRILGLMPHPERFVRERQHPNWRRMKDLEPQGLPIFQRMVDYAREGV